MVNANVSAKFPAALLSTQDVGVFGNDEKTSLLEDIDNDDTVLRLNDASAFEVHQWLSLRAVDGLEVVQIDAVNLAQNEVTVERGKDGTVGVAHLTRQQVKGAVPAVALNQLRVDLIATQSYLGVDGDCVTWDRAIKLSPTHDTCPILELDLKSANTNVQFIRFSVDGAQTGAMLYDAANDAVEFQNIRVDIGSGADLLLEDDRILRFGTDSDLQVAYDSAENRLELRGDVDTRWQSAAGAEALTLDPDISLTLNVDLLARTDGARSIGAASERFQVAHLDRLRLAIDEAAPGHAEGQLFYDGTSNDKTLVFHVEESEVALNLGQETWMRVRNDSGATITNGRVVQISGTHGGTGLPTIALADATTWSSADAVGLATHDIENNSYGYITTFGQVRGLDTSAFAQGEAVYLDPATPGGLVAARPSHPDVSVQIGAVTRVNATTGRVLVMVGDRSVGLMTPGSVFFADADGRASQDNANLFWDDTNNRLGVGTATPQTDLDISQDAVGGPILRFTNAEDKNWAAGDTMARFSVYSEDASGIGAHEVAYFQWIANTTGSASSADLIVGSAPFNAAAAEVARFQSTGQLRLSKTGSAAGILLGLDAQIYRGDSNRLDLGANDHLQIPSGDLRFDTAANGVILKDTQATPHYWRVTIDTTGALVTTDLGTSLPAT